jgi:hypothetical protein
VDNINYLPATFDGMILGSSKIISTFIAQKTKMPAYAATFCRLPLPSGTEALWSLLFRQKPQ